MVPAIFNSVTSAGNRMGALLVLQVLRGRRYSTGRDRQLAAEAL